LPFRQDTNESSQHSPLQLQGRELSGLQQYRINSSIQHATFVLFAPKKQAGSAIKPSRGPFITYNAGPPRVCSPCLYRQPYSPASAPCEGCPRSSVHALALKRHPLATSAANNASLRPCMSQMMGLGHCTLSLPASHHAFCPLLRMTSRSLLL
jgi:hypothetical protein